MGNIGIRIPELERMALRYPAFAESCEIEIKFLIQREAELSWYEWWTGEK